MYAYVGVQTTAVCMSACRRRKCVYLYADDDSVYVYVGIQTTDVCMSACK